MNSILRLLGDPLAARRLRHAPSGSSIATVVMVDGWWAKGVGVIGLSSLPPASGIVMPGVASIHTLFVRFPLDLIFLDRSYRLLNAVREVPPWRPLVRCPGAYFTVELAAGSLADDALLTAGDPWAFDAIDEQGTYRRIGRYS